ncbi:MAG: fibronectin type III domain-containing protein [Candidatus Shapirobacteria bacterium]
MKGGINVKTIIVLVILLLVGVLGVLGVNTVRTYIGGASADTEPKNVVAASGEDGKSAAVSWTSDKPSMAVVEYGTTPASLLLRAIESSEATDHQVSLTPLKSGTSYYFRIRVGEEIFDNSGIPYSFKTKAVEVKPTPTVVPTITPVLGPTGAVTTSCDSKTDYNKDGVVNSLDYIACLKSGNKATGAPASTASGSKCPAGVDFDKNGTVNSIDMIRCLQSNNN